MEYDLYGLAYRCPYLERGDSCPLKEIDHLSFKEKVEWIDDSSNEMKDALWNFHKVCSSKREH